MATTSIGNGSGGFVAAELLQTLGNDLGKELAIGQPNNAKTASADASQSLPNVGNPTNRPLSSFTPVTDVAAVLMSQIATSDLTKLTRILEPAPNPAENRILNSLLESAIQEVGKGNAERAIGYLADYATRNPRGAETLPQLPALEQVRDKINSMVSRMTVVAKMSAENGLSHAEQTTSQLNGKLSNWETHTDVLLQLAHRLFDSGGYANYSRTTELARLVSGTAETKPAVQALAASASASSSQFNSAATNQQIAGVNVPYWVSPDVRLPDSVDVNSRFTRRVPTGAIDDVRRNWSDLKEISIDAVRLLWKRAPLLVMMLAWFALGLAGGITFVLVNHLWPESLIVAIGNLSFDLWGIGFLALVGFGFYVRVRYKQ